MRIQWFRKRVLPLGLLLVCGASFLNAVNAPVPDVVNGFMMGMGIVLIVFGFIGKFKLQKECCK